MKFTFKIILILAILFSFVQCKKEVKTIENAIVSDEIQYAKGFSLENYEGYSVVTVKNPWPKATKTYTYILKKENGVVPDSLNTHTTITVPIKKIVVTSTTHIPSLEMLEVEKTLVGFPNLDYISSEKVRALIDEKKIKELGANQALNIEVLIDLQPDVIIGYGIDNDTKSL
jgi:iron complex transport system substrate-binding protein